MIENPYQSPRSLIEPTESATASARIDWKTILKRWELLRLLFNLLVGMAGGWTVLIVSKKGLPIALMDAVIYGILANAMYFFGPIAELYLNWFVDMGENRFLPRWLIAFVRSRGLTILLFIAGCLFSIGLTLLIGWSIFFFKHHANNF